MRALIWGVAGAAAIAIASMSSGQIAPVKPIKPLKPTPRFTPKVTPTLKPVGCRVDPAITSVTLAKSAVPLQVKVTYTVTNRGSAAWRSAPNQQNVTLTTRNANTGRTFTDTQRLPGAAAAGAQMLNFSTPWIDNAFDNFEFAGSLDLRIGYDPDILLDSNPCNDDANSANNSFHLDNGQLLGFMKGSARTQTFRP